MVILAAHLVQPPIAMVPVWTARKIHIVFRGSMFNSIQFKFYFTSLKKASTNYMDYNLRKQKQNRLHT